MEYNTQDLSSDVDVDDLMKKVKEYVKNKYPQADDIVESNFISNKPIDRDDRTELLPNLRGKLFSVGKKIIRYLLKPIVKYILTNQSFLNYLLTQISCDIEKKIEERLTIIQKGLYLKDELIIAEIENLKKTIAKIHSNYPD